MLPYFEQPVWHVGPLTIHGFGIAVAIAVWFGLAMVQRRFDRASLDRVVGERLGWWMIVGGIVGAHLYSVLLYFPDELRTDPWLLLRIWDPISSIGGMLGGITGGLLFFSTRLGEMDWRAKLAYLDAIAFVFPSALAIGRLGCTLAHDHPGVVTSFPLSISLQTEAARNYIGGVYNAAGLTLPSAAPTMGFHDLGLYELLFLVLVVVPTFIYLDRRRRPAGFYLIAFSVLYFPVRFAFDMLRIADARYLGLTPAQWAAALIVAALPFVTVRKRALRFAIAGAVIVATACACWGGPM
ncbi:MAG TPA: prolipoprotein diacylglyceryl transferase family protein [Gemmatimonadaceae bacterium]|nr:prolipoprotein diacylglyceryl transferase family protein [Gemmatimonadaceae bacterium]